MPVTQVAPKITLVGEEISEQWNRQALGAIAAVFGHPYIEIRGNIGAAQTHWPGEAELEAAAPLDSFDCRIAAENAPGALSVYSYRPPAGATAALFVGNEAKGLRKQTLSRADALVQIPMVSRNINCLNVAAAAAVMLYYLAMPGPMKTKLRGASDNRRPDLLLVGGSDPMELGSTVRSACAFGWDLVFLDDAGSAWYECDRRIKSEGRGAARRGRNPIKVVPYSRAAPAMHGQDSLDLDDLAIF